MAFPTIFKKADVHKSFAETRYTQLPDSSSNIAETDSSDDGLRALYQQRRRKNGSAIVVILLFALFNLAFVVTLWFHLTTQTIRGTVDGLFPKREPSVRNICADIAKQNRFQPSTNCAFSTTIIPLHLAQKTIKYGETIFPTAAALPSSRTLSDMASHQVRLMVTVSTSTVLCGRISITALYAPQLGSVAKEQPRSFANRA